jgi:hypothetical protein
LCDEALKCEDTNSAPSVLVEAILSAYSACGESFEGYLGDLKAEKRGFPVLGKRFRNLVEPC